MVVDLDFNEQGGHSIIGLPILRSGSYLIARMEPSALFRAHFLPKQLTL